MDTNTQSHEQWWLRIALTGLGLSIIGLLLILRLGIVRGEVQGYEFESSSHILAPLEEHQYLEERARMMQQGRWLLEEQSQQEKEANDD